MGIKLDELEEEREYLLKMCPADMRDTYEDGKEETLVRMLVRLLPAEYDQAVKAVKDLARLRKYNGGGQLDAITNCEDNTRANYAIDYLPNYTELRFELINTYQLAERRRVEMNQKDGKKGHPSFFIMDGHAQPGPGNQTCYRCGAKGHRAGDPACKGKDGEVQKDAPECYRKQNKGGRGRGKGKGKGKGKQKTAVPELQRKTAVPELEHRHELLPLRCRLQVRLRRSSRRRWTSSRRRWKKKME